MADDDNSIVDTVFPDYNGLARAALIPKIGTPLVPTLMCFIVPVMMTMFLLPFLNGKAFMCLFLGVPFFAFIKVATAKDDQALNVIKYQGIWFLRRRNYFFFGKTLTILATKYGRQEQDYVQFFEKINGKERQVYQYRPKYAKG
ncbi:MAG: VirB3 family type IV secretion system protein [Neisseriaceae bacterium]|nr:VirB3 family type IV secretion system protein [Neisseriaceae bacterium]